MQKTDRFRAALENRVGRRQQSEAEALVTLLNLEAPIDEIDALASLLSMARLLDDRDRHGYDLEFLDAIVLRRIRKLARFCQNAHARWSEPSDGDTPIECLDPEEAP
jgi:hypothetical protein